MDALCQGSDILQIQLKRPKHDGQLQREHLRKMQERMSDSEDNDSDFENLEFEESTAILNLNPAYGQAIALWSFLKYDNIAIFPPTGNDLVTNIIGYAKEHFGYKQDEHKLMLLNPGHLTPVSLKSVYSVRPGVVVMVMPDDNVELTIEISQLKTSFTLPVDLAMTVHKIKSTICKIKGVPVERQEILYSNKALRNNRRLFEYRVKNNATLYVMIQAHFDLIIHVETFWGKTYKFYIDPCSTGTDLVYAVFNRAFSASGPKDAGLHELYVPMHVLVLQFHNKFVNWDYCIAYLGIHTGEKILLTTVGHQSNTILVTINVVTESGEKYSIAVSQYDRWSILAFKLHGLTNVPVDLIRLYKDGKRIDFASIIGKVEKRNTVIMNAVLTHIDNDLVFGIPLKVSIGNGILENVNISASRTVRHLKKKLEKMGVPNASLYELTVGNQKLPNNSKIMDLVFDIKTPLVLKLETYPVFAHAPDGVIYKTYLKIGQTVGNFKHKIELKTGYSLKSSSLMFAGEELQVNSKSVLYDVGVSCRNSIFFKYGHEVEPFYILGNNWQEKVKVPTKPTSSDIRNAVWNAQKISEGSLNCVLTILYWFFTPRLSSKNKHKIKIKKRMPVSREMLFEIKRQEKTQFHERNLLPKPKKRVYSSPNPVEYGPLPHSTTKIKHKIRTDNMPKFEPDHINDPNEKLLTAVKENKYYGISELPDLMGMQRSTIPSWMESLQTRNKENRLVTTDLEGPDGMTSVHQSKIRHNQKKNNPRTSDKNHIKKTHNESQIINRVHLSDNFKKHKRFLHAYEHFDFITSEEGQ